MMEERAGRFSDRVALVLGGTEGIGREIVRSLVKEGAQVAVGARTKAKLEELEAELGAACIGVPTDVASEEDVEAAVAAAVSRFGRIDLAFNVAGKSRPGTIVDLTEENFQTALDISLKGTMFGMKHAARQMIRQGAGGAIVNVSSVNSFMPAYGGGAYASSKAAVDMLTKNAALELARHKIRVNALLPGLTETAMTKRMRDNAELLREFEERIAMQRAADPAEIAAPALFLASDEASYVTGIAMIADGGWALTGYPDLSKFF